MNNEVAIIIVNYNGYEDTCECIESIPENLSYKIIVIDNASFKDDSLRLKKKYKNIYLIESKSNIGFSGANNLGIKYAIENGFEYVLLLNNDTIIEKNTIEELIKDNDEKTITVPKMCYYNQPNIIWYAGGYIDKYKGDAKHYGIGEKEEKYNNKFFCDFATGCCLLIKTSIIKKIGLMDEKYFMYCEDVDYSIRLAENNIRIKYIPTAKLLHKVSASTGGKASPFSTYYYTRNRLYVIKKHRKYFYCTAFIYTIITRKIRSFLSKLKKDETNIFIEKAISDYNNNIIGKVDI